ncbi:MAG TPA: orotidine-5'-phosphate decarboxylase [Caldisericia bacterium]|mgnify:FL=1|jgi:orotidine-5'-phosphate decarboxylase|nr:orotidine-5'-phosphate decarboxylase [Caldisericia bacterium]HXK69902.1 orotidine-5'-phosphate decarboxylase [Caldisericia bacterium]
MIINPNERLIVSLDFDDINDALSLVDLLKEHVFFYKIGLQMYLKYGSKIISELKSRNVKIFLDLKLNDIPNTIYSSMKVLSYYSVDILNMHTLSGFKAMQEAKRAILEFTPQTKLVGVTVLTSLDDYELKRLGFSFNTIKEAEILSLLAKEAGLDGVISSAGEAFRIKELCGDNFITICPGIRRAEDSKDDQKRAFTPLSAIKSGADYIVVGRPITKAASPQEEVIKIIEEIRKGLEEK